MTERGGASTTPPGADRTMVAPPIGLLTDDDVYLFNEGTHHGLARKMGAHPVERPGTQGTAFAVWAPNADRVAVTGDFNDWDPDADLLTPRGTSGIWQGFVEGVGKGSLYKFRIEDSRSGFAADKADPFALFTEIPPKTAGVVWDLDYAWGDGDWLAERGRRNALDAPMSIYELHVGSWMRVAEEGGRSLSYRELAERLTEHVLRCGFTHVELLPIMEHPFFGSWGYQTTGYFAPDARFGTPQDCMYLIDTLHRNGIGVILDWVPSHFPTDDFALGLFDGTHLFEHADPRQGIHPDWDSYIFNYGRTEVRSFLLSSAMHWLSDYHADGLRVDAVASMLYLDYSRKEGEWEPNVFGGRENLEAIMFLRRLNEDAYGKHAGTQIIAEESTAWPGVSRPTYLGGLGFGLKWDMGWMHDTLQYFSHDPIHRRYHHNELTFRALYAFTENYVLPLSHDEVVHGKGSLLGKMPGDEWQRFANLRLLLGCQVAQPGKKLLFMGGELGQPGEWDHGGSVDWQLLDDERHAGILRWVEDLNALYRSNPAMHALDCDARGFEWVDANDADASVLTFLRKGRRPEDVVLVVCNLTPIVRENYRVGVPVGGVWREVLNSDAQVYGGSGQGNLGGAESVPIPLHGRLRSLTLRLPPLAIEFFVPES